MNEIATALYTTLTGGTALTNQLAGTASVYHAQAPHGAALPYVVFSKAGGGPVNAYPDDAREVSYFVRGYAESAKVAGAIDAAAAALLHRQSITVTGWNTVWCKRVTELEQVDNPPDAVPVYMAGGIYDIRIV